MKKSLEPGEQPRQRSGRQLTNNVALQQECSRVQEKKKEKERESHQLFDKMTLKSHNFSTQCLPRQNAKMLVA